MRFLFWALIGLVVAIPLLCIAAWQIAVPIESIEAAARTPLQAQGLDLAFKGLSKGLFFSLHADEVTVLRGDQALISASDADAALDLRSVILSYFARPEAGIKAKLAGGTLTGTATLVNRFLYLKADLAGAELASIGGQLEPLGLSGARGRTSATVDMGPDGASVAFTVQDAAIGTYSSASGEIPLGMFNTVRGALTIKNGQTGITSLSMEGRDVYAKASGNIARNGALDLTLAVMPTAGSPYAALLGQMPGWSKTGPGRYEIRLRTPGRQ